MIKQSDIEYSDNLTEQTLEQHRESVRKRAAAMLSTSNTDVSRMSVADIQKLIYELQVHQIELELQNEELNRTHRELLFARDRYARLYNSGTVGYLTLNQDGIILHANCAVEALLHCSQEKLVNTKFGLYVHPADQDAYYFFIKNFTGHPIEQILSLRLNIPAKAPNPMQCPGIKLTDCFQESCTHNSYLSYVECRYAVDFNELHEAHICLAIYDVTERKLAQESIACLNEKLEEKVLRQTAELIQSNLNLSNKLEELKRSKEVLKEREATLSSIFNASPDGIITLDSNFAIVSVNPAVISLFGYSEEELVGICFCKFVVNSRNKPGAENAPHYLLTQMSHMIGNVQEIDGLCKDGRLIPIELSIASFAINNRSYFTGFLRDISLRKQQERQDKIHLDELAHVTRLGLLGEMASSIAHELNQPLTAIAGYTDACLNFIKTEPPDLNKLRETFIKIYQQSLRAGQIIHRMRDFVKFKIVQRNIIDINKLIHDSVDLCHSELKLNTINLQLELTQNPVFVYVDSIQIEQIIINLIKNSIDALQQIPVTTPRQLSIQTRLDNRNNVEIKVKDNGSGMTEEAKSNVLTPFFTTKPDGMGMGLAISHSIIKAHEGTLQFYSKAGEGTAFYFTLPQQ